jgi:uridylate kinase
MAASKGYGRALLKISGEALAGERGHGLDPTKIAWIANEIAQAHQQGHELGVVVGGGNFLRGSDAASVGVPTLVGDQMGMIATCLNSMALRWAMEAAGVSARAMSAFPVGSFIEPFERERALKYVQDGAVVIFAGGTGNPCFTTDSAAALRAVEIDANVMVKATQVGGVFDKDPKKHPDATFFESITPQEVLDRRLAVIDAACIEILSRKSIPTIVLNLHEAGNILKALSGEKVGTIII